MPELTAKERALFDRLKAPGKIQDYLDSLPINHEKRGETCFSPRNVLREQKAHCLEGALFAAAVLAYHGERPLVMNLWTGPNDDDHAVTLFRHEGLWGAYSKTNHAVLRYRDPVYKSPREIAMSFFHEYYLADSGRKTLRAYSRPFDLSRFGYAWIVSERPLWDIAIALRKSPHVLTVPDTHKKHVRKATPFERHTTKRSEWSVRDRRT